MTGSRGNRGFDPTVAHPARVYEYWLGGKDNFGARLVGAVPSGGVARKP